MPLDQQEQSQTQSLKSHNYTQFDLAYALPGQLARLDTDGTWQYAPHLEYLEDKILDIIRGKPVRLLVSMPPRHGKSVFLSQYFAAWFLGRMPDKKILLVSYQGDYAKTWGRKARNVMKRWGPSVFGVKVAEDTSAANHWEIQDRNGVMDTAGAGGALTGKGADLFILDDLIKGREEALSSTVLEDHWDWFGSDVYPRLEPSASMIIIATRWSSDDLIGKLITDMENDPEAEQWDVVSFPAFAEQDDIMGRKEGTALWPTRYDEESIKRIQKRMTVYWFSAEYQQRPVPLKGTIINLDWFQRFGVEPSNYEQCIISFDTAQKEKDLADYTAIGVWKVVENGYYLTHVVRERFDHPRLLKVAKSMLNKWKPNAVLIEDKGSGISLIQHLKKETRASVIAIEPIGDKVMRMEMETPAIEAGNVSLPINASWLFDFEDEVRGFPRSVRKDQVDMLSQFLKYMREMGGSGIELF